MNRCLGKTDDIMSLSKKIERCKQIKKYDQPTFNGDPESWVIAYSLSEIEESCQKISKELVKKLTQAETSEKAFCILSDIREELRHVFYHIKDSKFFRHIL